MTASSTRLSGETVSRMAVLVGAWLSLVSLPLPWVAGELHPASFRLPHDAHGVWLAQQIWDTYAPASATVAFTVVIGTVVLALLCHLVATTGARWPLAATAAVVVALFLVVRSGVQLPGEGSDPAAFVAGYHLWRGALLLVLGGLVGFVLASETTQERRVFD
ncbi:hypothetical protein ASG73_11225 [Janibacter sp. Soil728]|uniref:hypothetical protein n=1 Tax=Janibacter sp. Soil728 TaxID=1736393 RepID=UPI000701605B|nr:hypothetical protein [Janibacter sp. Soil728]KRE36897.1 hypothetical protein ASG73_11225 [Janibacter sp. Soil728]